MAALTGGFYFDYRSDSFGNTVHFYLYIFLFFFPFGLFQVSPLPLLQTL